MFKKLFTIIIFLLVIGQCISQNVPIFTKGKITFQKKVNLYAIVDDVKGLSANEKSKIDQIKGSTEQFYSQDFTMSFLKDECLYKRDKKGIENALTAVSDLTIYTNVTLKKIYMEKDIGNDKFLISDSIIPMVWRITDETRTIQGIECRRANGLLFDSIYVVAFFASNIPLSGGPDIFSGLPGMILEVAVPQLHTTWLATDISFEQTKAEKDFVLPIINKKATSYQAFIDSIKRISKDWGFLKEMFFNEIRI